MRSPIPHPPVLRWPRAGRLLAVFAILLGGLALVAVLPPVVTAHSALISTDPADGAVLPEPPTAVTLTFNEPPELVEDGLRLLDAAGTVVPLDGRRLNESITAPLPADLADGAYVVAWQVISADGHPISGALSFTVGAAGAAPVALTAAAGSPVVEGLVAVLQGLSYLGLLAAVGLALFQTWIARAADSSAVVGWIVPAAGLAAVAGLLTVPVTVLRQQGLALAALLDPLRWLRNVGTEPMLALVVLLLGLGAVVALSWQPHAPWQPWALLMAAGIALASVVVTGHTRVFPPRWLIISADLLHAATGAFWFGGLLGLILYLRQSPRAAPDAAPANAAEAGGVIARFSGVAGLFIALLGLSGLVMGWLIVGSLPALLTTDYGRLLLLKVAIAGVVAALRAGTTSGSYRRSLERATAPHRGTPCNARRPAKVCYWWA